MAGETSQFSCVYSDIPDFCPGTEAASQEHYLPRGLGNFEQYEGLNNKICASCNEKLGRLDESFLRNSPEAFFREVVGRFGRKKHRNKSVFYEPTFGTPPICILGRQPEADYDVLWEVVQGTEAKQMRQIIMKDPDEIYHPVYIQENVKTPKQFEEVLEELGLDEARPFAAFFDPEEKDWIESLCTGRKSSSSNEVFTLVEDLFEKPITIPVEMTFNIHPMYYRAIAKIAFHFFLKYCSRFSGLEQEFLPLKRFITQGGNNRVVRSHRNHFLRNFRMGQVPNRWLHLLSWAVRDLDIVAQMAFFAGPKHLPVVWEVSLGRNPSRVIHPEAHGKAFIYYEEATPNSEFHGEVTDLAENRRIIPVDMSQLLLH